MNPNAFIGHDIMTVSIQTQKIPLQVNFAEWVYFYPLFTELSFYAPKPLLQTSPQAKVPRAICTVLTIRSGAQRLQGQKGITAAEGIDFHRQW
jgi:hypothetical protein